METTQLSMHPIQSIDLEGLSYSYIEKGKGTAIIFLHGFPDLANTWDESIGALSKNYRCIAPFMRGYYPTDMSATGDYTVASIAKDVVLLVEKLDIDKFYVIGQDWGASIAYAVANFLSNKIIKLVTIAIPHPSCIKPSIKLLLFGRHFLVFRNKKRGLKKAAKNHFAYIDTLIKRWSPDWENYAESSALLKKTLREEGRLEAALGYYWSFFDHIKDKEQQRFYRKRPGVPVLFLGGENDGGVLPSMFKLMEQKMPPGSKNVLFKNAGHFLHREIPQRFLEEVMAFIESPI